MILHVLLDSEHDLFSFREDDFSSLKHALPDVEIKLLHSQAELVSQLASIEWLDTWYFEASWYAEAKHLKAIFTPAAGREYVQTHPDIPVYFGTFHGDLMAETALGLVMQFSLRLPEYREQQQRRLWQRLPLKLIRNQKAMILGYGSIGSVCGQRLLANGMQVIGVSRQPSAAWDQGIKLVPANEMEQHLPEMDHVLSFLPGDPSNYHFISKQRLAMLSPTAHFYNFGRGTTVDEIALIAALHKNQLAGAALDVTEIEPLPNDSKLWEQGKITLLPHASAYFEDYRASHVAELEELLKIVEGVTPIK